MEKYQRNGVDCKEKFWIKYSVKLTKELIIS